MSNLDAGHHITELCLQESKEKLAEVRRQLKEVHEEADQVRRDCQGMLKTYHVSWATIGKIIQDMFKV